jgi:hypothetical protein
MNFSVTTRGTFTDNRLSSASAVIAPEFSSHKEVNGTAIWTVGNHDGAIVMPPRLPEHSKSFALIVVTK